MNDSMQSREKHVDMRHKTMLTLWAALLSALGLYFLLSLFAPGPEAEPESAFSMVLAGLSVVGISTVIVSLVIRRRFTSQAEEKQTPALVQTGLIVSLALCEIVGLAGLLVHFATGDRFYFVLFIISAVGMLLNFPRRNELILATYRQTGSN
jgi:hypothetical protein